MEDSFNVCWNCNYSIPEGKVIDFKEDIPGVRELNCLRCETSMIFSGNHRFHEGTKLGVLGNLFELFVNRESFDLYLCPKCGKVEFFAPLR